MKPERKTIKSKAKSRNCFVCDTELKASVPKNIDSINTAPLDGVVFHGYGNYGSTVWDNISNDTFCLLYVCDDCFKNGKDKLVFVRKEISSKLTEISENQIDMFY